MNELQKLERFSIDCFCFTKISLKLAEWCNRLVIGLVHSVENRSIKCLRNVNTELRLHVVEVSMLSLFLLFPQYHHITDQTSP